jgi:hypothetical protein
LDEVETTSMVSTRGISMCPVLRNKRLARSLGGSPHKVLSAPFCFLHRAFCASPHFRVFLHPQALNPKP